MDSEIFQRVEKRLAPFNGNVLIVNMKDGRIKLELLREVVETIFIYLSRNSLCGKVYKCKDWLQHDGILLPKERYTYKKLKMILKDNESFYRSRNGDYSVRNGYYDSRNRWYLRVYIVDKNDLKSGEERCGDFDISISDFHMSKLKELLERKYSISLCIENAYSYFERINMR